MAKHPALQTDPSFVDFLELEGDLPRATSTSALSGAGVMRLFSRVGDSLGKMTYKMDESDQVLMLCRLILFPRLSFYEVLLKSDQFYCNVMSSNKLGS